MSTPDSNSPRIVPVILAGGSGTRFWPRSRRASAKQVLALDGERTMIQQTVTRLSQLATPTDIWVVTNAALSKTIATQLPELSAEKILSEPAPRNTAPAAGLAAMLLERSEPDAVIGIFPADHVVGNIERFAELLSHAAKIAAAGDNIVVLGVPPTRPETGYGYIETCGDANVADIPAKAVRRFTEKPDALLASEFLATGSYLWNSGIFLCTARTLANAIREHCPLMAPLMEQIAAAWGTANFSAVFAELYPKCENISLDYAVIEPRSARTAPNIYCLTADFGWNDLGSWAALYEHKLSQKHSADCANIVEAAHAVAHDAHGNYVYALGKTVALVGVTDLVVVETDDALLITTRAHSQDVGKIVRQLAEEGRDEVL